MQYLNYLYILNKILNLPINFLDLQQLLQKFYRKIPKLFDTQKFSAQLSQFLSAWHFLAHEKPINFTAMNFRNPRRRTRHQKSCQMSHLIARNKLI